MCQAIEEDALFGQWTDSDFAGGVTDNVGQSTGWPGCR